MTLVLLTLNLLGTAVGALLGGLETIVNPVHQTLSLLENAAGVALCGLVGIVIPVLQGGLVRIVTRALLAGLARTVTTVLTVSFLQPVIRSVMDLAVVTMITARDVSRMEDGKEVLGLSILKFI